MWPSVPAYRNFAKISCPSGTSCALPHCIFGHEVAKSPDRSLSPPPVATVHGPETVGQHSQLGENVNQLATRAAPALRQPGPNASVNSSASKAKVLPTGKEPESAQTPASKPSTGPAVSTALPPSASRPISPPPSKTTTAKPIVNSDAPVPLMPRKLKKEPSTYARRIVLLKALHTHMKPQNDRLLKASKAEIKALHLSPNQLNKLAVDEEEKIAISNPSVYENILKQRLVKLKGMTPEEWVKERRAAMALEKGEPPKKPPLKRVDTGLSPEEEITFLRTLTCDQKGLDQHGYVTHLPSDAEVNETRLALNSAAGWEVCDRCKTRFQVFPDRNEEGALTTGGQCNYHWGRIIYPKKSNDATDVKRLSCCSAEVGSPGCSTHETHVFNVKDTKRLALIMPFIETPANDKVPKSSAVSFDCEMGYTTNGLELLRLTVISWPQHKPLIDVLVRPLGQILDFNTRFSGITRDQFIYAKEYDPANPKPVRKDLRIVESPYAARDLFLSHVSPETPVVGHALENDLNTIRLIHPVIIDTVLLYPTRQGLPFRFGLRKLAKEHLGEEIQQAGAAGHDSYEDARTTGELVRFKIKEQWKLKKVDGFEIRDGGLHPPMPPGAPPAQASNVPLVIPTADMTGSMGTKTATKRKLEDEESEDTIEEPPSKKLETESS
jgi:RNA exonuclease 1